MKLFSTGRELAGRWREPSHTDNQVVHVHRRNGRIEVALEPEFTLKSLLKAKKRDDNAFWGLFLCLAMFLFILWGIPALYCAVVGCQ